MSQSDHRKKFIDFIMEHRNQLFSFIYAHVPNMNDAEDIFQQTSIVLWEKFDQFESGTSFIAWASQVARHKIYDWNKTSNRQRILPGSVLSTQLSDLISRESIIHDDNQEQMAALSHCMEKLAESDRTLVKRCYGENTRINEVASSVNRSPSSVSNSLRRIRMALLACIERYIAKGGSA